MNLISADPILFSVLFTFCSLLKSLVTVNNSTHYNLAVKITVWLPSPNLTLSDTGSLPNTTRKKDIQPLTIIQYVVLNQ